ncbi:maleylpyruvate isomerase N-terminal domain-containing protein [Pseudonocardia acaciae]|uniref:maleylpyruvate isomerase N-terminal domain-containing protein n=1 Tax=Pseudonocardia acaciae TaxID=551276 RepID=UPI00048C613B|nr:maleylpyruvate isomerase N-terminal domain-containing protein [Pseudonocardia acaciae]
MPPAIQDEAMRAFIATVGAVEDSAPSWCVGWSARELMAHVTAAAAERADLIEEHLAGRPPRRTRSWEEREPPFRALPGGELRRRLVEEAARFERAADALPDDTRIAYTGWDMTARRMRTHSHSEAALHRWDLVGDDDVGVQLLSDPALTEHALAVFAAIPALDEAQRWTGATGPRRLRSPGRPDVVLTPGGQSLAEPSGAAAELPAHERLLVLWGRIPPRLRRPYGRPETVDDLLPRLTGSDHR